MIYKVKLSSRYVVRLLNEGNQKIKLFNDETIYTTEKRGDGAKQKGLVYVFELGKHIELKDIRAIKHQATRFNPDLFIFEEIDWNE